jgi:hypothetical protein
VIDTHCYLGVYCSDDLKARKSCEQTVLFGEVNATSQADPNFGWKYINLPCPHCGFAHTFKRSEWAEDHVVQTLGDYSKVEENVMKIEPTV